MRTNRRDFIKTSAVASAGFLVSSGNFRKQARASALQDVAVAGVGVGGKGGGDITQAGYYGKVVAICDVDRNTLEGKGKEFPDAKKYVDYRDLFSEMGDKFDAVTVSTPVDNVSAAPATINLAGAEIELVSVMARESVLRYCLEPVREQYDYVFVDCPPSLGLLTVNALVAADSLLVPIQCEFYALEGLSKLLESMRMVKGRLNPSLDIFGVVMTMFDVRTTLSRQVVEEVRDYFGEKVFKTVIPRNVKLSEAPSHGLPINLYDPRSKGAEAYAELAKEVVAHG